MITKVEKFDNQCTSTGDAWRFVLDTGEVIEGKPGTVTYSSSDIINMSKDMLTGEAPTIEDARTVLGNMMLESSLTEEEVAAIAGMYPAWAPGIKITQEQIEAKRGIIFSYENVLYIVNLPHIFQSDWTPDITKNLFSKCVPDNVVPVWEQKFAPPYFRIGDFAIYDGWIWECTAGDANGNNGWTPGVFGWTQVEPV